MRTKSQKPRYFKITSVFPPTRDISVRFRIFWSEEAIKKELSKFGQIGEEITRDEYNKQVSIYG